MQMKSYFCFPLKIKHYGMLTIKACSHALMDLFISSTYFAIHYQLYLVNPLRYWVRGEVYRTQITSKMSEISIPPQIILFEYIFYLP